MKNVLKGVLTAAALAVPNAALAMCETGAGGAGAGGCGHHAGIGMALMAALGYWVLHNGAKDMGYRRWAGLVVGWGLTVIGMSGLLCATVSHLGKSMCNKNRMCPLTGERTGMGLPPGHPPMGDMMGKPPIEAPKKGK